MRKSIIVIIFVCFFSCKKQLEKLSNNSSLERVVERIESSYKGIIVKKYSTRKTLPTHITIKTSSGKHIDISPNKQLLDFAKVGDSIYKYKDRNIAKIKTSDGDSLVTFYIKISSKNRNHENFPKEWKNKWLESTIIYNAPRN